MIVIADSNIFINELAKALKQKRYNFCITTAELRQKPYKKQRK